MYLTSLHLYCFRNYPELSIRFSPGLNVIFGDNAQGKTNLLEAIHFLATGKSHRTSRDQELIQDGAEQLRVRAAVMRRTGELDLEIQTGVEKRKQLKINGISERKIARLVGNLAVVFFSPDDLQLLKGSPAGRRRFLDVELSQISQTYLHHLITYKKVLTQRNRLLKEMSIDRILLSTYDDQLINSGAEIVSKRAQAVERLSVLASMFHHHLSDGKEQLRLEYQSQGVAVNRSPTPAEARERLQIQLEKRRRDEARRQVTLVGPHRDDLAFWINDRDARVFASQGQQRTAVLAVKLAELEFMAQELGEYPVLLLDDVASELDPHRRQYLLDSVREGIQTFVTCTDLDDLTVRTWPQDHRLFRVRAGAVQLDSKGLA